MIDLCWNVTCRFDRSPPDQQANASFDLPGLADLISRSASLSDRLPAEALTPPLNPVTLSVVCSACLWFSAHTDTRFHHSSSAECPPSDPGPGEQTFVTALLPATHRTPSKRGPLPEIQNADDAIGL